MPEESPKSVKCKSCGGPLPYRHGENVLHCNYCGSTTMLADYDNLVKIAEPFIIPNRGKKANIMDVCRKWMSEGVLKAADLSHKAGFARLEARYLPFWVVHAHATTRYESKSGSREIEGSREEDVAWTVYARTDPGEFFGFWALNPGAKSSSADWGDFPFRMNIGSDESEGIDIVTGREPFDQKLVGDIEVVNGQITDEEAQKRAQNEIATYSRKKVADEVGNITSVESSIHIKNADLVYIPLWSIEYNYGRKSYRMLVQGYTGSVLAGEAPVGKWDKTVILAIICGISAVLLGGAAAIFNFPYFYLGAAAMILIAGIYAIKAALS